MPFLRLTILFFGLSFASLFIHAEQNQIVAAPDSLYTKSAPMLSAITPDSILNYGKLFLNTPYRYGACGTEHFDCSGFTSYVFGNFGYHLDRSSAEQANQFPAVEKSKIKPGDLVFFNGRRRNGRVGHVGIVVNSKENGEFDFMHASVKEGVIVSSSTEDYYVKRFVKAARVFCSDSIPKLLTSNVYVNSVENGVKTVVETVKKFIPAKYHIVKAGDNLSTIALKYGIAVSQLKKQNKLKKDHIALKQRLLIEKEKEITVAEKMPVKSSIASSADTTKLKSVFKNNNSLASAKHKVRTGESLFSIAKQYDVSVDDLKELNHLKDAKILPGQEIKIGRKTDIAKEETAKPALMNKLTVNTEKPATHKVEKGETLGSIACKYNISQKELIELNGLKNKKILAGQTLKVGMENQSKTELAENEIKDRPKATNEIQSAENASTKHKVTAGESLYSISKKYNISIDELKDFNGLTSNSIKPGQTLKIDSKSEVSIASTTKPAHQKVSTHKVRSGENLTTIAEHYNCSIRDLKKWNNKSNDKLSPGEKLKVYTN